MAIDQSCGALPGSHALAVLSCSTTATMRTQPEEQRHSSEVGGHGTGRLSQTPCRLTIIIISCAGGREKHERRRQVLQPPLVAKPSSCGEDNSSACGRDMLKSWKSSFFSSSAHLKWSTRIWGRWSMESMNHQWAWTEWGAKDSASFRMYSFPTNRD